MIPNVYSRVTRAQPIRLRPRGASYMLDVSTTSPEARSATL
jgi:hypothetical protein